MSEHTPGPWEWRNIAGAGLEIFAPVHRMKDAVLLPQGMPDEPIHVFGMNSIAHERWVQFSPEGWDAMQQANARLIAAAPTTFEASTKLANEVAGCWSAYDLELRQVMGHTNYNCVAERLAELRAALSSALRSEE